MAFSAFSLCSLLLVVDHSLFETRQPTTNNQQQIISYDE